MKRAGRQRRCLDARMALALAKEKRRRGCLVRVMGTVAMWWPS